MTRFSPDIDARRLGEVLAALRRERGFSQAEAGARAGMTSQGWGLYEAGRRSGLFRPDVQRRLTTALGASVEDFALLLAQSGSDVITEATPGGVEARRGVFTGPPPLPGSQVRTLQLSNDDLAPWAASGVVLEYDPTRWPRRDQGCVLTFADGSVRVRIYDRSEGDILYVRKSPHASDETIAKSQLKGVAAVTARLER